VALHLLAAAFAVLMLARHGGAALRFLSPRTPAAERWRALPGLVTAAVALLLLAASLRLYAATRP
jgi:UPF0716 family protein affecting phage T7 exclusion